MRRWVERMASGTRAAAEAKGREGPSRAEAHDAGVYFVQTWRAAGRSYADFERFRDSIEAAGRGAAYQRIAGSSVEAVEDSWIGDIDADFGLSLSENILWFLLWRSGKPPTVASDREAA